MGMTDNNCRDSECLVPSASSYILSGHAELGQVAEEVHVRLEDDDYSTVSGLVMNQSEMSPWPVRSAEPRLDV